MHPSLQHLLQPTVSSNSPPAPFHQPAPTFPCKPCTGEIYGTLLQFSTAAGCRRNLRPDDPHELNIPNPRYILSIGLSVRPSYDVHDNDDIDSHDDDD